MTATPSLGAADALLQGLRFALPEDPLPALQPARDPDTDWYWRCEDDGVLRLLTCGTCGYLSHPPGPRCARCHSTDVAPRPVSGRGTVWAWSVNLQPFLPGLPPFCIASVQIEEQDDVRLTTQLVDCVYEDVREGLPVEVVFVEGAGGVRLPFFRPARA